MKKIDLLYGFLIGILASFIGVFLFIGVLTDYELLTGISAIREEGKLGKLITLGAILNIVAFFLLLKMDKEMMARGVVLATIILTVVTLIV